MMQPLDLNLASRPFRNNTLLWVGHGLAIVLLALFSVWSVQTYLEHRRLLADMRGKVTDFETRTRELETRTVRAQDGIKKFNLLALRTQADKANEVIDWKAFSWTRLFNLMAEIQPYKVRMTSIRPIFRSSRRGSDDFASEFARKVVPVSIQGTAKDWDAVFELIDSLLQSPQIGRVEPDRQFKAENGEVIFELRFYYLPPETTAAAEETLASAESTAVEGNDPSAADPGDGGSPEEAKGEAADSATDVPVVAGENEAVRRPVVSVPPPAGETAPTDGPQAAPELAADAAVEDAAEDAGETVEENTAEQPRRRPIVRKSPGKPGRKPGRSGGQQ